MQRLILIFALAIILQGKTWSQGIIGIFPTAPDGSVNFGINFVAVSNAPLDNLPTNSVCFYSLVNSTYPFSVSSTNVFNIGIEVGATPNTGGWILQMGDNGFLTPVIELNIKLAFSILSPFYFDTVSMQLNDAQVQGLSAGKWYAEVDFGSDGYLGQLSPVPEPSCIKLIFCGGGFFILLLRRNRVSFSVP